MHAQKLCTKSVAVQLTVWGEENIHGKGLKTFSIPPSLYPTPNVVIDDNEKTVVALQRKVCALVIPPRIPVIQKTHAVADTGTTSVFIMTGTPMTNINPATHHLTINLPDGRVVKSTHVCDMVIPGLPTVLEGHIVHRPRPTGGITARYLYPVQGRMYSCFFKHGVLHDVQREHYFNRFQDPSTDICTLPITPTAITKNSYQGDHRPPEGNPCHEPAPV